MTPRTDRSRAEQLPSCWKMRHEPTSFQSSLAVHAHATGTLGATFSGEGRLAGPGAASLDLPPLLCDTGAAAACRMHAEHR